MAKARTAVKDSGRNEREMLASELEPRPATMEQEAALLDALFSDPDFEDHVIEKVLESLDNPGPLLSLEEVLERVRNRRASDRDTGHE